MAAQQAVFRPPGRILAIPPTRTYISTPNLAMYLMKLVGTIQVTKKYDLFLLLIWSMPELRRNGRLYVLPKNGKWAKNPFFAKKVFPHPTVGALSASNSPSTLSVRAG